MLAGTGFVLNQSSFHSFSSSFPLSIIAMLWGGAWRIERGECAASIDLLVEVAVSLKTTLDFLICGVTETPRERELSALIEKQHQNIQKFKMTLNSLMDELEA